MNGGRTSKPITKAGLPKDARKDKKPRFMSSPLKFLEAPENPAALTRRRFLTAACAGAGIFLGHPVSRSLEGLGKFPGGPGPGTPEGLDRVPAFPLLYLPGEGTDPMHPLPPAVPGRARRDGETAGCGRTARGSIIPWSTAIPAPSTWTRWKRSPFSTCFRPAALFPSPPPAAICTASSARTGRSPGRTGGDLQF